MAPKNVPSGVKHNLFGQSLYLVYHCILFGPPLLYLSIFGPHKNHPIGFRVYRIAVEKIRQINTNNEPNVQWLWLELMGKFSMFKNPLSGMNWIWEKLFDRVKKLQLKSCEQWSYNGSQSFIWKKQGGVEYYRVGVWIKIRK